MQQRSQRRHGPLPTIPIVLSTEERKALEHLCRSGKIEHRVAMRARAILLAADGWPNDAIARHLERHHTWVRKWRRRFPQGRLDGLRDRPRSGRPPRLSPLQHTQIVGLACTPPAKAGRAWVRWSVRALHDEIKRRQIATLHPSTVHHILTDADLHPHQVRYWRHALAEDFEAKAASVLWYYERVTALADRGELVVCLDEKPNIQALGRAIPDLPPAPGYALRRDWEYVRYGTVNLLVIYNLLTGQLWGRVLERNDAAHFLPALEGYLAELPWEIRCVHCILDQGASHIAKTTREWIAAQEGLVRFHFTPAHASWLNQAELALSAFSRRYLCDRVSESRQEAITHIYRSLREYNRLHAHPFQWSFTRHAMHEWYSTRTRATVH